MRRQAVIDAGEEHKLIPQFLNRLTKAMAMEKVQEGITDLHRYY